MGGVEFPLCCLTWDQTMVEVMNTIMTTSFKRSHVHIAAFSAPEPAAGHCQPMPPSEARGHSQTSLSQSLLGSLLLSPGFWCTQDFVCSFQESVSSALCKFYNQAAPRTPAPVAGCCWPIPLQETQTQVCLSLCGVSVSWCTLFKQGFVWTLWEPLEGMGFNSKCDFVPPTVLQELLLCPWMYYISFWWELNIQKTKIMGIGPKTSWQIDGETMEIVTDLTFLGSKITADGDCSHEIKRRLLLGRKVMTYLYSIKSRGITNKGPYIQSYGFSRSHVWMWVGP